MLVFLSVTDLPKAIFNAKLNLIRACANQIVLSQHDCATVIEMVFKDQSPRYIFAGEPGRSDPHFWTKCAAAELETVSCTKAYVDFWSPTPTPTLRLFTNGDLFILLEYLRACGANINNIRNNGPVCATLPMNRQELLPIWRRVELEELSLRRSEMCVRSSTRMDPEMIQRFDQIVIAMTDWRENRDEVVQVARILLGDVDVIFASEHDSDADYVEFIRQERSEFVHVPICERDTTVLDEALAAVRLAGAEIRYE
jgi:hypothetical protein